MSQRKKLEQGRAEFAYKCAQEGKNLGGGAKSNTKTNRVEDSKEAKEYKSYVKKIPMLIKTNGLGSTFAFVKSKQKKEAYSKIYEQTYQYLKDSDKMEIFNKNTNEDLVQVIISQESSNYRYLTVETLAFFAWLKRFAEGLIEGEVEGGGEE